VTDVAQPRSRPQFRVNPPPREAVYEYVGAEGDVLEPVPGRVYDVIGTTVEVRHGIPWITFTVMD
jgi:hypothetical protein